MKLLKKKRSLRDAYWPNVSTPEGAKAAVKAGFFAAAFCAVVTGVLSTLAMFGIRIVPGIDAWGLVDAGISTAIAIGIQKHSRFAAWCGLIFYVGERVLMISKSKDIGANPVLAIVLVLSFISGIRGTNAFHRMKEEAKATVEPPEATPIG